MNYCKSCRSKKNSDLFVKINSAGIKKQLKTCQHCRDRKRRYYQSKRKKTICQDKELRSASTICRDEKTIISWTPSNSFKIRSASLLCKDEKSIIPWTPPKIKTIILSDDLTISKIQQKITSPDIQKLIYKFIGSNKDRFIRQIKYRYSNLFCNHMDYDGEYLYEKFIEANNNIEDLKYMNLKDHDIVLLTKNRLTIELTGSKYQFKNIFKMPNLGYRNKIISNKMKEFRSFKDVYNYIKYATFNQKFYNNRDMFIPSEPIIKLSEKEYLMFKKLKILIDMGISKFRSRFKKHDYKFIGDPLDKEFFRKKARLNSKLFVPIEKYYASEIYNFGHIVLK